MKIEKKLHKENNHITQDIYIIRQCTYVLGVIVISLYQKKKKQIRLQYSFLMHQL